MTKLFCGIDVAKFEHVASIYDPSSGEIILDSLHFDNNDKGFQSLLSHLSKLNKDNELFIGFESTSHYHQALFNYLTARKYKCYLINPYMTSKFRSISLRDVKTDDIDSKTIAQFLSFDYCNLVNEEFLINELKDLAVQRHSLMTDSSRMKIKLKSYLDRVFPELESLVDIDVLAVTAILKKYPTARSISSARIDRLKNRAREASKGKYSPSKVESVKEAAKASIGIHSPSIGLSIVQCIETLELKERQIDTVDKEIKKHPTVLNPPLHQLTGINDIEIAYIMSAIISITRFSSPGKVVAFAGLDPKIRQSGTWKASTARMSKRGNKLLGYALIWTAYNITRKPGPMKDYYDLKKSQGKSHYNALGHCASKLCRYIFWILNHPDKEFKYQ